MRSKILIFSVVVLFCVTDSFGQEQISADVYKEAEQSMWWNTRTLTEGFVRPWWRKSDQVVYDTRVNGERVFVKYDAKKKKKKVYKDREKFVADLGSTGPKLDLKNGEVASPDEKKAVFIRDWNLWIRDIASDEETQLTYDGVGNFGYATDNAGWRKSDYPVLLWSEDSKKIATYQQDQRHVSDMYMIKTKVGAPELKEWKYPLPQDEKVIMIHRVIIDVDSKKTVRLKMDPDPRRGTLCDDITCDGSFDDNQWSKDGSKLIFVSSSRDHKVAQLRVADSGTGEVKDIYREEVETQYESGQGAINWRYLEDENTFIWYSEKDNWGHLYLHDFESGKLKNQITKGDFVVTKMVHIDKKNGRIYFEANGKESGLDPYYTHLYSVDMDGGNMKLLTPEKANHRISYSEDHAYFVDNYSTSSTPPVTVLRSMDGKEIEVLEKGDISKLKANGWKAPTNTITKSADGRFDLYGLMFQPINMKKGMKYPVVNYVYPGPQGGGVGSRSFSASRRDHQALANLGFVVIVIDGSCNPGRSKDFHDACYGDMSINTLPDQISGIKELAKKYTFIDTERVGIWGHSGGGFATATALFKHSDFYKVGISESGNHDNRNYEDDWGERYNGLMVELGDGKTNYEIQANQLYAENLTGKLMIAHGGMDDNVPVSNSMLVVDALIKANKDFDLVIFPNARHGFGDDSDYMMRKRWDYFVTHLQGNVPPKEYVFREE